MVRKLSAPVLLLGLLAALLSPPLAGSAAADEVTSYSYDVTETFTITLNDKGDATCKDVLKYDASFFNTRGFDFEKYPFLLSRRYRAQAAADEITAFNADLDRETSTVTLTFKEPGRAYNMGTHWTLFGFPDKPDFTVDGKQVFVSESSVNSDYTLWQDLEFKTTTYVKLPAGATNVRWNKADKALFYELAYTPPDQGNTLQRNQALFIPLFAVLALGSLAVGAYAIIRGRRLPAVQAAGLPSGAAAAALPDGGSASALNRGPEPVLPGGPEPALPGKAGRETISEASAAMSAETGAAATDAPEAGAGPSVDGSPAPDTAGSPSQVQDSDETLQSTLVQAHFCRHCGAPLPHGDANFCPNCGGRLADGAYESEEGAGPHVT